MPGSCVYQSEIETPVPTPDIYVSKIGIDGQVASQAVDELPDDSLGIIWQAWRKLILRENRFRRRTAGGASCHQLQYVVIDPFSEHARSLAGARGPTDLYPGGCLIPRERRRPEPGMHTDQTKRIHLPTRLVLNPRVPKR